MTFSGSELNTSYSHILSKAWPIILANAAVPTLGLVDTAVIGHFGNTSELAALAIASLLFSFIYWSFGFLRMGTTAYVAQADGANNEAALMRVVLQSALISLVLAALILTLQRPLLLVGMMLIGPPDGVDSDVSSYFSIRIWGAPATLATYVLSGYFIGRGFSRCILILQLVLNGLNACLDIVFAGVFGWGISGIAWGTVLAEYLTFALGVGVAFRMHPWRNYVRTMTVEDLRYKALALLNQNGDIFIRTLFLLVSFGFFTHISAGFGAITLAANHILLQFTSFSAFFMDGYAHVLESLSGRAVGQRSWTGLRAAFLRSSLLAFASAVILASITLYLGTDMIRLLTNKTQVIAVAQTFVPMVALYIFLSVAAFQLDGLFIGTGYSSAMRNCSIFSTAVFVALWFGVAEPHANIGLWWSFVAFVLLRAFSLAVYLPKLKQRCTQTI